MGSAQTEDAGIGNDSTGRPVLLREPAEGTPPVITDPVALAEACARLAAGTGAVAVDTERASGYRY